MTTREMQIEFERVIQLIDDNFVLKEKLDTEHIMFFLNVAQEKYLKTTYLSKDSLQENAQLLQKRADDLKQLIERTISGRDKDGLVATYATLIADTVNLVTTEDGGMVLRLPYNYIYYMLSRSKVTRSTVAVASDEWTPNKVITHDDLDHVVQTPFNDPILRKPCVLFEDTENMVIYYDSDTAISDIELIYIKKPDKLLLDTYTEYASADGFLPAGIYQVVSDVATYDATTYNIGDTFTAAGGVAMTSGTAARSDLAFGTNTCELAEYTHQEIVDLAVKIFVEEVKYKLSPTQRQNVEQAQAQQSR